MSWLGSFHFLRPFWLLIAVPALLAVGVRLWGRKSSDQWKEVIAPHLLPHLITQRSAHLFVSPEVVALPFVLILAVSMAGPAYRLADSPEGPDDTTLLIAIDLSSSMKGRDIGPSRIKRLRLKLRDLIDLRRGARIGLIAVAGDAHVVMPPTDDGDALVPYIDVLDPSLMPTDGESFQRVVPLVRRMAKNATGPVVLLVAADSIPPDGAHALVGLSDDKVQLVGWTVGTQEGVPGARIPGVDRSGFDTLSRAGAQIVELSLGGGDLRRLDRLLDRARTAAVDPDDASLWEDSGYPLSFVFALGVLFWFRRGWVIGRWGALALLLLLTGCNGQEGDSVWLDLWLTPDQQGRRSFDQGRYLEAARKFDDPMWKGVAYYVAHDWKHAQEQFARVDSVEGMFNLANAQAQDKAIASAIASYNRVLERRPTFVDARKNRDYLREVLAGLARTSDFDDLKQPSSTPPDPTKAELREDQKEGARDKAAEAANEKGEGEKKSLTALENERWMKRVATNPADFLRAKFAIFEQEGPQP